MRAIALTVLAAFTFCAAEGLEQTANTNPLPTLAIREVGLYEAALKREQDKLVAALTRIQEQETRAGHLEAALAVKAEVEKYKGLKPGETVAKPATKVADEKPAAKPTDYIGTWNIRVGARTFRWVITADAKIVSYLGDAEFRAGRLRMDRANPTSATMEWSDGGSEPLVLLSPTQARYTSKMGDLFVATKQQ